MAIALQMFPLAIFPTPIGAPGSGEALGLASGAGLASRGCIPGDFLLWPQLSVGRPALLHVLAWSPGVGWRHGASSPQLPAWAMAESGVCSRSRVTNRIVGAFQACVERRLLREPRGCSFLGDE